LSKLERWFASAKIFDCWSLWWASVAAARCKRAQLANASIVPDRGSTLEAGSISGRGDVDPV
jgi:hypothetical protein